MVFLRRTRKREKKGVVTIAASNGRRNPLSLEADMTWQPGTPIRTEQDETEWRTWRWERILTLQRDRRARMRRIDYYPSPEAVAVIDRLQAHRAGGDTSSVLNRIVGEWATGGGIPEFNGRE